jgi:hypothetical protein
VHIEPLDCYVAKADFNKSVPDIFHRAALDRASASPIAKCNNPFNFFEYGAP